MTENERLRALLKEARASVHLILDIDALQGWACEAVDDAPPVDDVLRDLRQRIDAALAATETPEGHAVCEFCKGRGTVPAKKPWSPSDVLGGDDGR